MFASNIDEKNNQGLQWKSSKDVKCVWCLQPVFLVEREGIHGQMVQTESNRLSIAW